MSSINVLIIDDHPMVVKGYCYTLASLQDELQLKFDEANNCDDVLFKLEKTSDDFYSLILLDISIPASRCRTATGGEDLGIRIRSKFPETKIIVQTGLNDISIITNVFHSIKPEGFLTKSDIDEEVLINAVSTVLQNKNYYSSSVRHLLSNQDFEEVHIDALNRQILYHLSLGYKMKDLPYHIPLSLPSIERRKKDLKSLLGVPEGGNHQLLKAARTKGFI
ncbi:response regulator [Maribacter sp. PR1]|uniref:Response regulator n=1 Tax=Maribacter cobaltidurans TaxID=1178778 RepID=A0ABU7J0Q8_9FLAO|nr:MULTISPECIES: response regulator [Maribacter]MDC6390954.1 response regulator [Maribacter sp. PR1]MEE1978346.1 response regulator [Maribacter cobaltidurans]